MRSSGRSALELVGDGADYLSDAMHGALVGIAAPAQVGLHLGFEQLDHVVDDPMQLLGRPTRGVRERRQRGEHADRQGLLTATAFGDAELNALAGLERRTGWQRRRVDINISTVVAGQEAKALVRVEPLDLAARHRVLLARNRVPGYPAGEPGAVGNSLRRWADRHREGLQ